MRTSLIGVVISLAWAQGLAAQDSPPVPATVSRVPESIPVAEAPVLDSIQSWYYPFGKLGKQARVVFRATIGTDGRVEPETIRLVSTTDTSFVAAARLTLMVAYYRPASAGGRRLRVVVQQAIKYDRNMPHACELTPTPPIVPPDC